MKFLSWLKSIPSLFWKSLEQKGKYTTILGIFIILGSVTFPLVQHNKGAEFTEAYLFQTIYFILAGIILIILPSEISISKTDGFKIKD